MTVGQKIGQRLRALRAQEGLSQQELALKCGMAPSYYSALERGQKNPTINTLARVGDVLNASIGDLVAGDELRLSNEVDTLLTDIPSKLRPVYMRAVREVVLAIREATVESTRRITTRDDIKRLLPSS